jgi:hypothetical protein
MRKSEKAENVKTEGPLWLRVQAKNVQKLKLLLKVKFYKNC